MKAIILAGGRGKRLGALSRHNPKPMLPVKGHPFLEYIMAWLSRSGFKDVILCTGYLSQKIEEYFGRGECFGLRLTYSVEDKPLGTAGALQKAKDFIDGDFILLNGDSFIDIDLRDMVKFHYEKGNKVTMAITGVKDPSRYGTVEIDNYERVINFSEKSGSGNFINAGVYVCTKNLLKKLPRKIPASLERNVFPHLTKDWVGVYKRDSFFIDIGTVRDYSRLKSKGLKL